MLGVTFAIIAREVKKLTSLKYPSRSNHRGGLQNKTKTCDDVKCLLSEREWNCDP